MDHLSRRTVMAAAAGLGLTGLAGTTHGRSFPRTKLPGPEHDGDAHRGMCVVASVNGLPAVRRARELMASGTDPLDAIVDGVAIIEDDPEDTSVGLGGLPNQDGIVELDASVMYGPTHKSGAVASLRNIKNPARVALLVCRRTDHCLLVGEGALRFARQMGFKEQDLLTEASRRTWQQWRENMSKEDDWLNDDERDEPVGKVLEQPGQPATPGQRARHYDDPGFTTGTVHVSGVTAAGDVASCTSTSGLSWKIPGRVGDSPIIGAGNYCDNAVGAAGCTGRGEAAIANLSAHTIVSFMEHGMSPSAACLEAMKRVADRTKEKRLRDGTGRPIFDLKMYAVRKDGAWGGASMYAGASMAVADSAGARAVKIPSLFDHPLG